MVMTAYTSIADAAAARHRLSGALAAHLQASHNEEQRLRAELAKAQAAIAVSSAGIDLTQVAAAEVVVYVRGAYVEAGSDRATVVRDAIAEIATGEKQGYRGLWFEAFGTKSYAQWHGQRCDNEYGYGPKHGSVIFQVGLRDSVRAREPQALTDAERNACVYYLTNLEQIQAQRARSVVTA